METEIIDKLNDFLKKHTAIIDESGVVYLMVELRKILDREKDFGDSNEKFELVRFYADWTVHTQKDIITPAIKNIMTKISNSLDPFPRNGDIDFIYMFELKNELTLLFKKHNLENDLFRKGNWFLFVKQLSKVLTDQPLINPIKEIKEFCYSTGNVDGIMVNIVFNDSRGSIDIGRAD